MSACCCCRSCWRGASMRCSARLVSPAISAISRNRVFQDSLLFPFALSLIGVAVIAAGLCLSPPSGGDHGLGRGKIAGLDAAAAERTLTFPLDKLLPTASAMCHAAAAHPSMPANGDNKRGGRDARVVARENCGLCRAGRRFADSLNTCDRPAAGGTPPAPIMPPSLPPSHSVNLMTQEGIKAFGTQWKVADVKIVEVPAIPNAMPKYKTTYSIEPRAGESRLRRIQSGR